MLSLLKLTVFTLRDTLNKAFFAFLSVALALPTGSPCVAQSTNVLAPNVSTSTIESAIDRSPVDLVVDSSGNWIVSANETSDSISLIDVANRRVVDEVACGQHPSAIAITPDDRVLVSCGWSGEVVVFAIQNDQLERIGGIDVGFHPHGLAVNAEGTRAYVGLNATGEVAELDLVELRMTRKFAVGQWPRYLTLSPDGSRLAVGCSGESEIRVVDTQSGELLYEEPLSGGINLGHMVTSEDGLYAYFPWMVYRTNPITVGNIRRGWVLASRIGRVRLDGPAYREAISLDVPEMAVADPHGLAITPDTKHLVASASGTHELLVYRLNDLPFVGTGGPGDLIERELQFDRKRFFRIPLGGRPMGIRIAADSQTVFVANYLRNSIQWVDLSTQRVEHEVDLGGPQEQTLERRGMAVFYDGQRSLDQWYSCHSCHQDGGVNSKPMDTLNDGTEMTLKSVLPLYGVTKTGPWTWHGWQTDLTDAMHKSITTTMRGAAPSDDDKQALIAYLDFMPEPPNPFLAASGGKLSDAAQRGREVFQSANAACADCHSGDHFTDGENHDVGLGSEDDLYDGFNTPSLRGLYRKTRWLHNGRAKTLQRLLNELHSPEKVSGGAPLTESQTADLIEYLLTL
ncbi:hypothetical protein [Stieleria varia]|uniref:Lactonase, 7-bladed beta-propeller n=1 Tax=Stieleria varia TaxID=2528005 RepID=A0A5C6AGI6_9BACT|nr:hypothetical protein [Stieleria varia]TWT98418.1 Lactonase, 7-bladed beta-propeller [Stieleria varia]